MLTRFSPSCLAIVSSALRLPFTAWHWLRFLGLKREEPRSPLDDPENLAKEVAAGIAFRDFQSDFETVILHCRAD